MEEKRKYTREELMKKVEEFSGKLTEIVKGSDDLGDFGYVCAAATPDDMTGDSGGTLTEVAALTGMPMLKNCALRKAILRSLAKTFGAERIIGETLGVEENRILIARTEPRTINQGPGSVIIENNKGDLTIN